MGDLFEEGDEELERGAPSPFQDARELAPRRPQVGRPKGARNRHSVAFERLYYARGYRDPLVAAAQIISEDPVALFAWLREHDPRGSEKLRLVDVVRLQLEAGRDIAPYLHGKAPVRIHVEGERLPYLVINRGTDQLAQAARLLDGRARRVGVPLDQGDEGAGGGHGEASEIKDLEGEE